MLKTSPTQDALDALHLSDAEAVQVVRRIERTGESFSGPDQRSYPRHDCDPRRRFVARLKPKRQPAIEYVVRGRNVGAGGAAFLHGSFIYPQTPCDLVVRVDDGQRRSIAGRVVRCRHVADHIHEIGVSFNQPLKRNDPLTQDSRAETSQSKDADATRTLPSSGQTLYRGHVLCVESNATDAALAELRLRRAGLNVVHTSSAAAALRAATYAPYDLALVAEHLTDATGIGLARLIRRVEQACPVVLMTGRVNAETTSSALDAGCDDVLRKPIQPNTLDDTLGRFLPRASADPESLKLRSTLWSDAGMRPVIQAGLAQLNAAVCDALSGRPSDTTTRWNDLAVTASGLGYPTIAEAARRVMANYHGPAHRVAALRHLHTQIQRAINTIDQADAAR